MSENRNSTRTPFRGKIRIRHQSFGEIEAITKDISDKGVFLLMDYVTTPEVGMIVKGQLVDLPGGNAPVVDMEVVRCTPDGIGLKFCDRD